MKALMSILRALWNDDGGSFMTMVEAVLAVWFAAAILLLWWASS